MAGYPPPSQLFTTDINIAPGDLVHPYAWKEGLIVRAEVDPRKMTCTVRVFNAATMATLAERVVFVMTTKGGPVAGPLLPDSNGEHEQVEREVYCPRWPHTDFVTRCDNCDFVPTSPDLALVAATPGGAVDRRLGACGEAGHPRRPHMCRLGGVPLSYDDAAGCVDGPHARPEDCQVELTTDEAVAALQYEREVAG